MKFITTTLLIIFNISFFYAQEFAPIGARWYVQMQEPFAPEWTGTLTNESLRDTIVKDLNCKVIYKSQATIFNEIRGEYILCQQGDSIYHYITSLDSMNLVMDFGATVGESWESFDRANEYESFGTQKNYKYTVDSISYLYYRSDDSLKVQHLTVLEKRWSQPDSEYFWDSKKDELIERIGFKSALLPTNGGDGFTDDILETDVRCYEDPIIGLIKLTEDNNCITSSIDQVLIGEFKIYPNPNDGIIKIEGDINSIDRIDLISSFGKTILSEKSTYQLSVQELPTGVYYLYIYRDSKKLVKKIVIHN